MNFTSVGSMSSRAESDRIAAEGQLGIISGSGPEAGLDLWKKLLHIRRAQLRENYRGDLDAPQVKIISLPLLGLSMDMAQHADYIWPTLREAAEEMAQTCKAYTIACNTLHYFARRLHDIPGGQFISVQDTVRRELELRNRDSFALLGAKPVMSLGHWSPYAELQEQFRVETVDSEALDRLIYYVKTMGSSTSEVSGDFMRIVNSLHSDIVVLGCTELPLIDPLPNRHIILDVTSLLATGLLSSLSKNGQSPDTM